MVARSYLEEGCLAQSPQGPNPLPILCLPPQYQLPYCHLGGNNALRRGHTDYEITNHEGMIGVILLLQCCPHRCLLLPATTTLIASTLLSPPLLCQPLCLLALGGYLKGTLNGTVVSPLGQWEHLKGSNLAVFDVRSIGWFGNRLEVSEHLLGLKVCLLATLSSLEPLGDLFIINYIGNIIIVVERWVVGR